MKITKSRLKEIINEEYRAVLSEQDIPTVAEFTDAFKKAEKAKWAAWTTILPVVATFTARPKRHSTPR